MEETRHSHSKPAHLLHLSKKNTLMMVAVSSLQNLIARVLQHANHCKHSLVVADISRRGHVAVAKLKCAKNSTHCSLWSPSPQLRNGRYLINNRVQHGLARSGMLPVHYRRFADGAGISKITDKQQRGHSTVYKGAFTEEYHHPVERAMQHEIGMYDIDDNWQGINIMTDEGH